jgi:hypothetical protein
MQRVVSGRVELPARGRPPLSRNSPSISRFDLRQTGDVIALSYDSLSPFSFLPCVCLLRGDRSGVDIAEAGPGRYARRERMKLITPQKANDSQ